MKSRNLLLTTACLLAGSMIAFIPTPTIHAEAGPTRQGADASSPKPPTRPSPSTSIRSSSSRPL